MNLGGGICFNSLRMCRLFAQISPTPASAEDFLVSSEFSLLKQSDFNKKNLQEDGWGIAYFGNKNEPVVSKSSEAIFKEKEKFARAAHAVRAKVVIGHIRAASNPRGIAKDKLINMENSQPYTDGRWIFAHNGTLQIPEEIAENLGALRKNVKSLNDSEVYFWQFIKHYGNTKDPAEALEACIRENWSVWERCKQKHPEKKTPYTSLNVLLSDGSGLYAFCHAVHQGLAGCGVRNPTQPWNIMSWTERQEPGAAQRLIAGSENLDRGLWTRFSQPELLSVEIRSGKLDINRRLLDLALPRPIEKPRPLS